MDFSRDSVGVPGKDSILKYSNIYNDSKFKNNNTRNYDNTSHLSDLESRYSRRDSNEPTKSYRRSTMSRLRHSVVSYHSEDNDTSSKNSNKKNFATGISLQIQQWKTVAEFESDEQFKFLVFSELKNVSQILFYLCIACIILSIIDIQVVNRAIQVDEITSKIFVTPQCWPDTDLTTKQIESYTLELFNLTKENLTTIEREQKIYIINNIHYGNPDSILMSSIQPWKHHRSHHIFSPKQPYKAIILIVRSCISLITILMLGYLYHYYTELTKLYVAKKQLPEGSKLYQVQLFRRFLKHILFTAFHIPPIAIDKFFDITIYPYQWFTTVRIIMIVFIWLREHHPMRYNRMTEILCTLSSVRLNSAFLVKSPFLRRPLKVIIIAYLTILLVGSYTVYLLEHHGQGYCNSLLNSFWLVMVTTTNLGFGDYLAGNVGSKITLAACSIMGIILMALLVNYVSEIMAIPPDEKRIIGFYEKHRMMRLQRIAASNLIKSRYKLYKMKCNVSDCFTKRFKQQVVGSHSNDSVQTKTGCLSRRNLKSNFEKELKSAMVIARNYEMHYQHNYRRWLKIKSQTEAIQHQLRKGFQVDDTAIAATYISRKLDDLESSIAEQKQNNKNTEQDVYTCDETTKEVAKKLATIENKQKWIRASKIAPTRHTTFAGTSTEKPSVSTVQNPFNTIIKQIKYNKFTEEQDEAKKKLEDEAEQLKMQLSNIKNKKTDCADLATANHKIALLEELVQNMCQTVSIKEKSDLEKSSSDLNKTVQPKLNLSPFDSSTSVNLEYKKE